MAQAGFCWRICEHSHDPSFSIMMDIT
jgi:hypothetical protein